MAYKDVGSAVKVHGFDLLGAQLKAEAPELAAAVRRANRSVAKLIVEEARGFAEGEGAQAQRSAHDALHTSATFAGASIKLVEDARTPFALGAEFGAKHDIPRLVGAKREKVSSGKGRRGSHGNRYYTDLTNARMVKGWNQFREWRGNQFEPDAENGVGYWLHPAVRESRTASVELVATELKSLLDHDIFID